MALVLSSASSQYAYAGNPLVTTTPFTMVCWAYPYSIATSNIALSVTDESDDIHIIQARGSLPGDYVAAGSYDGSWSLAETTAGYTASTWQHFGAVFTSSTLRDMFIDGGSKGSNTGSQNPTGLTDFIVGSHKKVSGNYWDGKICHVAVWDIALSDAEMATLAAGALPTSVQPGNLIAYYPLVSNGNASVGSYDLTEAGGATYDASDPLAGSVVVTPAVSTMVMSSTRGFIYPIYVTPAPASMIMTTEPLSELILPDPITMRMSTAGPSLVNTGLIYGVPIPAVNDCHQPGWVQHEEGHDPRHSERQPVAFQSLTVGPRTAGSLISIAPNEYSGVKRAPVNDAWYEHLHFLPRVPQVLGNIVSEQSFPVELYNADRFDDITITSVTDALDPGVTITGVPSLPFTINSQDSVSMTCYISTTGGFTVDSSYTFHADDGTSYVLTITGTRIVLFPIRPEAPLREHLIFDTQILVGSDGTEQRISNRKVPRSMFEMTIKESRQRMEMLLMDRQSKIVATPAWHEPSFLTSDVTVGDYTINVDQTGYANFYVGGHAIILQDEFTYDTLEITAKTSTTLTFNSPSAHNYASSNKKIHVMPLMVAWFNAEVSAAKNLYNEQTFSIRLDVEPSNNVIADSSGWNTYNGKLLLDDANMVDGNVLAEVLERKVLVLDNITGLMDQLSIWDRNKRRSFKGFKSNDREQLWKLRKLLHYLDGQRVSFYIPTFSKDLVPNQTLINASTAFNMDNIGYTINARDRAPKDYFRMILKDGTVLLRTIVGSAEISAAAEQLTVDTAWPYDIDPDDIERIEFLEKIRFNVDDVVITHYNALGQAKCTVATKEVFD